MNTAAKEKILNEAIRIGDELISKSEKNQYGIYWKCVSLSDDEKIIWREGESIYQGVSGIVLFFIELYKQTNDKKYLNIIISAAGWLEDYCKKNPTDYYAFFTGRMGVSYVMLELAKTTGDKKYIQIALEIAKEAPKFLESTHPIDDLINGISGTLLGLLHLHAATKEEWIMDHINRFTEALMKRAHPGPVGLYWDRSSKHIRGLCGFSHGASGIGFIFLELGHYFNNPAFYWVAEQAFLYENYFFDKKIKNWPDFRRGIYKPEDYKKHKEKYYAGETDFFTKGHDMAAWCHGAPGIGLARIRAYQLMNNPTYKEDAKKAIEKTKLTTVDNINPNASFNLCHGGGGNADLFIDAYCYFKEKKYIEYAQLVAEKAIEYRLQTGIYYSGYNAIRDQEGTSLFIGNAGIGYFYLRIIDPLNTPSVLAPSVDATFNGKANSKQYASIAITLPDIKKQMLAKSYKRTLALAIHLHPEKVSHFFDTGLSNFPAKEKDDLKSFIESLGQTHLKDIFELEDTKREIEDKLSSHALLYLEQRLLNEKSQELIKLEDNKFVDLELQLKPDISFKTTKWDWSPEQTDELVSNLNTGEDEHYVLFQPTYQIVTEKKLEPLTYMILISFEKENKKIGYVTQQVVKEFEVGSPDEEREVKKVIADQIKELLLSGILTERRSSAVRLA